MTSFEQKFIENPQFIKWIFNTNPTIETYWEQYLAEQPEEKTQLFELKEWLMELKFSNNELTFSEKEILAKRINLRLDCDAKQYKRKQILFSFMRYAAVALIFSFIGGLVVYIKTNKESLYQKQASQIVQYPLANQGAMLITSNGKNVDLKKSNSTVDYSVRGSIVLNNDSVLKTADDELNFMNQLVIPYGNQSKVVLADGTVVWLNAGSRLVYPTSFKDQTREVCLFGEAFFEVAENKEKIFIVKVLGIDIKALGTKFNVSAYPEDNVIQTVLKEGSVAIQRNSAGFFENDVVIQPNQMALFNKTTNDTKIYKADADIYYLWTKGLISFDEIDFSRVIKQIERFYNISINFSDHQKEIMRISGKLDLKRDRKEVMEYLEKVSLSRFEQLNENQYIIK